jgi:hypothetical protein
MDASDMRLSGVTTANPISFIALSQPSNSHLTIHPEHCLLPTTNEKPSSQVQENCLGLVVDTDTYSRIRLLHIRWTIRSRPSWIVGPSPNIFENFFSRSCLVCRNVASTSDSRFRRSRGTLSRKTWLCIDSFTDYTLRTVPCGSWCDPFFYDFQHSHPCIPLFFLTHASMTGYYSLFTTSTVYFNLSRGLFSSLHTDLTKIESWLLHRKLYQFVNQVLSCLK